MGARGAKQKQKLLYLAKIMLEKTDDNHGLTVNENIDLLEKYDITAERKSPIHQGFFLYRQMNSILLYNGLGKRDSCLDRMKLSRIFMLGL